MRREQSWISRYPLLHIAFNAVVIGVCLYAAIAGTADWLGL